MAGPGHRGPGAPEGARNLSPTMVLRGSDPKLASARRAQGQGRCQQPRLASVLSQKKMLSRMRAPEQRASLPGPGTMSDSDSRRGSMSPASSAKLKLPVKASSTSAL